MDQPPVAECKDPAALFAALLSATNPQTAMRYRDSLVRCGAPTAEVCRRIIHDPQSPAHAVREGIRVLAEFNIPDDAQVIGRHVQHVDAGVRGTVFVTFLGHYDISGWFESIKGALLKESNLANKVLLIKLLAKIRDQRALTLLEDFERLIAPDERQRTSLYGTLASALGRTRTVLTSLPSTR